MNNYNGSVTHLQDQCLCQQVVNPLGWCLSSFERVINELILVLMPHGSFSEVNWSNSSSEASSKCINKLRRQSQFCEMSINISHNVSTKNLNGLQKHMNHLSAIDKAINYNIETTGISNN